MYDVSDSFLWRKGTHQVLHSAGVDLTDAIRQAPNGGDILEKFLVVGIMRRSVEGRDIGNLFVNRQHVFGKESIAMPSSVLSHQGIVLPLKIKCPDRFDGTALCVGSFAPDLAWFASTFLGSFSDRGFHSIGELVYTVPISILLVILFDRVLLPLAAFFARETRLGMISRLLSFLGIDDYQVLRKKRISIKWVVKATYSVLLGIFSHFLLDLPTHGWIPYLRPFYEGEMPRWFLHVHKLRIPFYGMAEVTNFNLLWFIFSIGFGILALYFMQHMKKHQLLSRWYRRTGLRSIDNWTFENGE